ncbi:MAG: class I SAM-dependent methyltransferase, partial [Sulfurimonas sp.]
MSRFDNRAKEWDQKDRRVNGAKTIAKAIENKISLTPEMEILDFGVGTGLLGFEIAKKVKSIDGVDTSEGMLKKLEEKNTSELFITPLHQDILKEPLSKKYDGVVSSMTLHHVANLNAFFSELTKIVKDGGFIAIADLEKENGTFHSDNTGVHHFGFDEVELREYVERAGFRDVMIENI